MLLTASTEAMTSEKTMPNPELLSVFVAAREFFTRAHHNHIRVHTKERKKEEERGFGECGVFFFFKGVVDRKSEAKRRTEQDRTEEGDTD